jgi:hypothetical protein
MGITVYIGINRSNVCMRMCGTWMSKYPASCADLMAQSMNIIRYACIEIYAFPDDKIDVTPPCMFSTNCVTDPDALAAAIANTRSIRTVEFTLHNFCAVSPGTSSRAATIVQDVLAAARQIKRVSVYWRNGSIMFCPINVPRLPNIVRVDYRTCGPMCADDIRMLNTLSVTATHVEHSYIQTMLQQAHTGSDTITHARIVNIPPMYTTLALESVREMVDRYPSLVYLQYARTHCPDGRLEIDTISGTNDRTCRVVSDAQDFPAVPFNPSATYLDCFFGNPYAASSRRPLGELLAAAALSSFRANPAIAPSCVMRIFTNLTTADGLFDATRDTW